MMYVKDIKYSYQVHTGLIESLNLNDEIQFVQVLQRDLV